jgi:hypothetical protein
VQQQGKSRVLSGANRVITGAKAIASAISKLPDFACNSGKIVRSSAMLATKQQREKNVQTAKAVE